MKQLTNEAFSPEESKKIYDNFLSIIGTRRDKLVKRYGAEAEKVAYAKAVKQVKKQAEEKPKEEPMDKTEKRKEIVKDALKNPKKADLNKDGKISDYEKKRGAAIEKAMMKEFETDEELIADEHISEDISEAERTLDDLTAQEIDNLDILPRHKRLKSEMAFNDYVITLKALGYKPEDKNISEDIDIGHTDDEPGMLKAEVYRIGKYAMELYKMLNQYDKMDSEVDFPHWWQSKISKAKSLIVSAKHYLDFEMKEPQIDAMVDVASEEGVIDEKLKPSMGAGAYVDDFKDSKAPQFKGKSKKKKQEMAVAAYLSAKDKKKVAEAIVAKLREGKSEYAKIEKQMFDLKKDGKRNTPEYEKLIKQRAELEKSKK